MSAATHTGCGQRRCLRKHHVHGILLSVVVVSVMKHLGPHRMGALYYRESRWLPGYLPSLTSQLPWRSGLLKTYTLRNGSIARYARERGRHLPENSNTSQWKSSVTSRERISSATAMMFGVRAS